MIEFYKYYEKRTNGKTKLKVERARTLGILKSALEIQI